MARKERASRGEYYGWRKDENGQLKERIKVLEQ